MILDVCNAKQDKTLMTLWSEKQSQKLTALFPICIQNHCPKQKGICSMAESRKSALSKEDGTRQWVALVHKENQLRRADSQESSTSL